MKKGFDRKWHGYFNIFQSQAVTFAGLCESNGMGSTLESPSFRQQSYNCEVPPRLEKRVIESDHIR
jgi:hypothetical protein